MNDLEMNYALMVERLKKSGETIRCELSAEKADLIHMAMGVSGEAGELLDAIKKHTIYNKPLDLKNVIEELGDLHFFIEGICAILSISREEILKANMEKLSLRYKDAKYSDEEAQARADKE